MSERITLPVIRVKDKLYTGLAHVHCVNSALADGALSYEEVLTFDYEKNGLFLTTLDRILTRDEAYKEFGIRQSHEIPKQRVKE